MIADDLASQLGRHLGDPVAFRDAPVRLGGGFFTDNYVFRLTNRTEPWDGHLVARLFPTSAPDLLARREAV
ncbi:MAG TPA: hypothetical protein VGZ52_09860, partial [Acidimicrobiales bacterium]|nr:hypothetical protein [Acidimicrobiales bacterium]